MAQWRCTVCNWTYDEEKEGVKFEDLPPDWVCPICNAPKSAFVKIGVEVVPFKEGEVKTCVAERMVTQVVALGINCIYGIPGDSNLPLVDAFASDKPALVDVVIDPEAFAPITKKAPSE